MPISIRGFLDGDTPRVRELFVAVNRMLAPAEMHAEFEIYIARALHEEIDRIGAYYNDRRGAFWVAEEDGRIVGNFGLEQAGSEAMELRRMYVDPAARRRGIGREMLGFAEAECLRRRFRRLVLSTSELQAAAIALYEKAGYRRVREEVASAVSSRTVGAGVRRFHFEKTL